MKISKYNVGFLQTKNVMKFPLMGIISVLLLSLLAGSASATVQVVASNTVQNSSLNPENTASQSYVLIKTLYIPDGTGTINLSFQLGSGAEGITVYGKWLSNGTDLIGVEQSTSSQYNVAGYVWKNQTVSGTFSNTTIELWVYSSDIYSTFVQNAMAMYNFDFAPMYHVYNFNSKTLSGFNNSNENESALNGDLREITYGSGTMLSNDSIDSTEYLYDFLTTDNTKGSYGGILLGKGAVVNFSESLIFWRYRGDLQTWQLYSLNPTLAVINYSYLPINNQGYHVRVSLSNSSSANSSFILYYSNWTKVFEQTWNLSQNSPNSGGQWCCTGRVGARSTSGTDVGYIILDNIAYGIDFVNFSDDFSTAYTNYSNVSSSQMARTQVNGNWVYQFNKSDTSGVIYLDDTYFKDAVYYFEVNVTDSNLGVTGAAPAFGFKQTQSETINSNKNQYYLGMKTDPNNYFYIERRIDNTETNITNQYSYNLTLNQTYRVKLYDMAGTKSAKIWAKGTDEPPTGLGAQVSVSDTTFPIGFMNYRFFNATGYFDNVSVYNIDQSLENGTIPIDSISGLSASTTISSINWSWANPSNADFNGTNIYIDGNFTTNLTKTTSQYNISVGAGTSKTISIRTFDYSGDLNSTWVNLTSTSDTSIINESNISYSQIRDTNIVLNWTSISDTSFMNYSVYRSLDSTVNEVDTLVGSFSPSSNISYNDTGLSSNTQYYYSVKSYADNSSSWGNVLNASTYAQQVRHILEMGDSITKVPSDVCTPNNSCEYPIKLNSSLNNYTSWIVNASGVGGENSSTARNRFIGTIQSHYPDIVTIMYGTNDLNENRSQQDIIDDIIWMANESTIRDIKPYILLTINASRTFGNNSNVTFLDTNLSSQASNYSISIINTYDAVDTTPNNGNYDTYNDSNYVDGVHPNSIGMQAISDKIYAQIMVDYPDITPASSITNASTATGNFWINNTWTNPVDVDFNGTVWKYANGTAVTANQSASTTSLNLTWSPHFVQNISAQTVDTSGNINATLVWFNATIPNNPMSVINFNPTYSLTEGDTFSLGLGWYDLDTSDTPIYTDNSSNWSLNPATGDTTWVTSIGDAGVYSWQICADDSNGSIDCEVIEVTVSLGNYVPPTPLIDSVSSGFFFVNQSWTPDAGNITNSYNVSVNGVWVNGTTSLYNFSYFSPHGWSNLTVFAYNSTGTGSLSVTPLTNNVQISNSVPVLTAIGNQNLNEGSWLNFSVSGTDGDSDSLSCSSNNTLGTFASCNFSWLTNYSNSGTYQWVFYINDTYSGSDSETITVTVADNPLIINSTAPANSVSSVNNISQTFNATTSRLADYDWLINGTSVQNNTSVLSASYINLTGLTGYYNVTLIVNDSVDTNSTQWNWTVIDGNLVNFTFSNISQSEPQIYMSSQANRISVQVSDFDGSISSVSVGITYLGWEANYSMTNSSGTWSYDFKSGVPGSYTVTNLYATDNASGTNSTTTGLSFVVVPLQTGGTGGSSGSPTVTPTPTVSVTPQPTSTQSPLIPLATPNKVTVPVKDNTIPSVISAVSVGLSGLNNAIMDTFSNPSTTSQWLDSQIATVFRSDNFFAGSTVEDFINLMTPMQWQIGLLVSGFLLLLMFEKRNRNK